MSTAMPETGDQSEPLALSANVPLERLAEAAQYAVLRRVIPMLRHDLAGAIQPISMIVMVLQRRLQSAEPDLPGISKSITSISALTREAMDGCMNAMSWLAPLEDTVTRLQTGVDEIGKLLAIELSSRGLAPVNEVPLGTVHAPQKFFRNLVAGALLAFCDQTVGGKELRISHARAGADDILNLRLMPDDAAEPTEDVHQRRTISWSDVQAMADSGGVKFTRVRGWVTLSVPVARV